ncbi:MAG: SPOR domain-containing protein [Wenzhouxiangella sp.]|jgi:hypothetical protein|nr:SPOR domain-containing protein [Wenzhouxiangella sp.]
MIWRWLAAALLVANVLLLLLFLRGAPPAEQEQGAIPALDPELPRLELVNELTNGDASAGEEACYSIGPLSSLLAQERAEDRLRPFALSLRSRQTRADSDRGWWVYLTAGNRAEAVGLTRRLAEQGVEDFYVVTSGDQENTVSVGLYEDIDNARGRQARIRALGFNAQLEVRREIIPQFWVDYRIVVGERTPWRFIVRGSPGSRHREIPCWDD